MVFTVLELRPPPNDGVFCPDFYIFNFADCLVTVAAVLLIINQIYETVKENKLKKEKAVNG